MPVSDISSSVRTSQTVIPMVYAYTTPEIARHDGWTKIGYTEAQSVEERIKQQSHTTDTLCKLEWKGSATYDDGSGETFTDHDFHGYLSRLKIERLAYNKKDRTEFFHVNPDTAHRHYYDFRQNRGILTAKGTAIPYTLRKEQAQAVQMALDYNNAHENGEVLWNAKPRFGKTLSVYDFCKRVKATNVLILTNRPAIADSWYNDYVKFVGAESGMLFVSNCDAVKNEKYCLSREEYIKIVAQAKEDEELGCIEFVSLQDLKGSLYFGGTFDKLKEISGDKDEKGKRIGTYWDVLVLDEAHEGVETEKSDIALDHIARKFTINLSGTPFKMLANEKFPAEAIFNWTYADEQARKREQEYVDMGDESPYAFLPRLNMFTYQMSEVVGETVERGIDIDEDTYSYFFDLNEFFKTNGSGKFEHDSDVDRFLDAMVTQTKYPFSTPELRDQLKHTFWLLDRIDSAKALKEKLQKHEVFNEYAVILAAGSGDDERENKSALADVKAAIQRYDKTITLSVGQLTTGVTIPEWTAVMMLCNCKSPALYMQAAFRAQNPCLFNTKNGSYRKENAYVFDFDPARTLDIFEKFANNLSPDTAGDKGDSDTRKQHVRELLNFFPVLGEDDNGEMIELDAEKVLSIPRHIHAREVVKSGFMSNFLFQNINNIFGAPKAVLDVLNKLDKVKKTEVNLPANAQEELSLNDEGEVELPEEKVIGTAVEKFGNPIFGDIQEEWVKAVEEELKKVTDKPEDQQIAAVKQRFNLEIAKPIAERVKEAYGNSVSVAQKKEIERDTKRKCEHELNKVVGNYTIQKNRLAKDYEKESALAASPLVLETVKANYEKKVENLQKQLNDDVQKLGRKIIEESAKETVQKVETKVREKEKRTVEDDVRDHLRGFSRTIPSFLMAYGSDQVTLANFDKIIPDKVFEDVTSITPEQFRFLRDGGDYEEDGVTKHYYGHLFDEVVFNDSVREFLNKKHELANYFEESHKEDIFDYVPPQRTNQIFTPRRVVDKMIDLLEEQNPGCFDDPENTFADLYMKSGLYITEIVKKLYKSEGLKKAFPNDSKRLYHILEKQVYGAAPTEIIYMIAMHYIWGFDNQIEGLTAEELQELFPNFVLKDTAELAKNGEMAEWAEKTFGELVIR